MSGRCTQCWLISGVLLLAARATCAQVLDCLPERAVPLRIRIGGMMAQTLQLSAGRAPALQLRDAAGTVVWSAAPAAPASQIFAALDAGFTSSLTPLDTDGDGLHDRLYAGDLGGRLWRFDIDNGAPAERLFAGAAFAELGGAGRAFVAPPDVSLAGAAGGAQWLEIAIGSLQIEGAQRDNRFYLLRDHAPLHRWSAGDYAGLRPLHDEDLRRLSSLPPPPAAQSPVPFSGFYLPLSGFAVLAQSITVAGRVTLAGMRELPDPASGCRTAMAIGSIAIDGGAMGSGADLPFDDPRHWWPLSAIPLPASAGFALSADPGSARVTCHFGRIEVAGCAFTPRWQRRWWLREDAD